MEPTNVSPFALADTYRIGLMEGFKAGAVAGVVGTLMVKAIRNSRKKNKVKTGWKFDNWFGPNA